MRAFEMRFIIASIVSGSIELLLRFFFHYEMFGYLGTGLILYGLAHYTQLKIGDIREKRKN